MGDDTAATTAATTGPAGPAGPAGRSGRDPGGRGRARRWWAVVRVLPFAILAVASIWAAGRAPDGRHAPSLDPRLPLDAVLNALTKWPHVLWMAVLCGLAVLAVGPRRLWAAAVLTLAVGVGWELAETTVVGHHARLVDLLPDLVGIAVACAVAAGVRALVRRRTAPAVAAPGPRP